MARPHTDTRKAAIEAAKAREKKRRAAQAAETIARRECAGETNMTGVELQQIQRDLKAARVAARFEDIT